MKGPGPRTVVLIAVIANVIALASLFLPYSTEYFVGVSQQYPAGGGSAWDFLFPVLPPNVPANTTPIPFWYYFFSGWLLFSILFPLGLHLASLKATPSRAFFLWSFLVTLVGVTWSLFFDFLILVIANHYGSTEYYVLDAGAVLLLFGLLLSGICDIYRRSLAKKLLTRPEKPGEKMLVKEISSEPPAEPS